MKPVKNKKWKFIIIIWSSWVWKWTLIELLKKRRWNHFFFPISAVTREMREWEVEWKVYNFISKENFEEKIEKWEFLEWAKVHWDVYYWSLKEPILNAINQWKNVVRELNIEGFDKISQSSFKENLKSIFILPPSQEILKDRIRKRAKISDEELNKRMESMKEESVYAEKTDFQIKNINWGIEEMYENLIKKIDLII